MNVKCPKCKKASTKEQWNEATSKVFRDEIVTLFEDTFTECEFICPICEASVDGNEFDNLVTLRQLTKEDIITVIADYFNNQGLTDVANQILSREWLLELNVEASTYEM